MNTQILPPAVPSVQAQWPLPRTVINCFLVHISRLASSGAQQFIKFKTKKTQPIGWVFLFRSLAMTYSHMGKPHTTIGDASFHF